LAALWALAAAKPDFERVEVKKALESSPEFGTSLFEKLLTRVDSDHIFLSDVHNLIYSIEQDFPGTVKVSSIGQSWQNRSINLVEVDLSKEAAAKLRQEGPRKEASAAES